MILSSGIGIAGAETLTGDLGTYGWNSTNFNIGTGSGAERIAAVYYHNIEVSGDPISLIVFPPIKGTFDANADPGAQTTFTAYEAVNTVNDLRAKDTVVRGTGIVGYQRLFDASYPPVELPGYFFVMFNEGSWNNTGLSGDVVINLTYNPNELFNATLPLAGSAGNVPSGKGAIAGWNGPGNQGIIAGGSATYNQRIAAYAYFEATKPSGLGITGFANKTHGKGGVFFYNSRAFISDINHATIASDNLFNPDILNFNVPNQEIYVSILSPENMWFNSSLLFGTEGQGNVSGYKNITIRVKDQAGSPVYQAYTELHSGRPPNYLVSEDYVATGLTNVSGMITFSNVPASAIGALKVTHAGYQDHTEQFSITSDLIKDVILRSPSLSLYLDVKDWEYGYYLQDVTVGIKNVTSGTWRNSTHETGAIFFDSTGASGQYPLSLNETVILAATKAGYREAWKSVTIPKDKYLVTLSLVHINGTAPTAGNFSAVIAARNMSSGMDIAGASITIQELGRMSSTNAAGAVTFRDLPVGTYTVLASAPGYESTIGEITGSDGDTVMKVIRMLPKGWTQGPGDAVIPPGGAAPVGGNQTADQKAEAGVTSFLDNLVTLGFIGVLIVVGAVVKKAFWG